MLHCSNIVVRLCTVRSDQELIDTTIDSEIQMWWLDANFSTKTLLERSVIEAFTEWYHKIAVRVGDSLVPRLYQAIKAWGDKPGNEASSVGG